MVGLSVSLSVCVSMLLLQAMRWPISHQLQNYASLNNNGDFPETTAFEGYAMKTSEKANMHNRTGLTVT